MEIKKIVVGELATNCYILKKGNQCLIVDPGSNYSKIIDCVGDAKICGILITHAHFDHVGALSQLKEKHNCKVYNYNMLEEKKYKICNFEFEVIFTPGHTSDSVSYYFNEKHLFTGDFLFKGTIGRYDLPTGDYNILMDSLDKIKQIKPSTIIYPGHGELTTLKDELKNNTYLNR